MRKTRKSAQGAGTIRKRTDGRWEARFTTGFDPASGKQVQKSIYGKTQKEVREKLAQITTELDDGTYLEPTKDTVGEWLDTWLETYVKYSVKPYTLDAYQRNCDNYIIQANLMKQRDCRRQSLKWNVRREPMSGRWP